MSTRSLFSTALVVSLVLGASAASAQEAAPAKPKSPRPPYALPFALRPALAPNVVRLDGAFAFQRGATTIASTLTGGGRLAKDFGLYGRAALVHDARDGLESRAALSNPLLFAVWAPEVAPKTKLALMAGVTAPIGGGGGDTPSRTRTALLSGIYARQAMDNALFAMNYLTPIVGAGLAWVDHGFTVQVEATVLQLIRVKGEALDADDTRTNFTSGLSVGYMLTDFLAVNAEAHYQRWLSTPVAVERDSKLRDQLTVGGGVRATVPIAGTTIARPGVGYFQGVDDPMAAQRYRILQIDVPILF